VRADGRDTSSMSSHVLSATEWAFGVGLEQAMGWPCRPNHCDPIQPHTSGGKSSNTHARAAARSWIHLRPKGLAAEAIWRRGSAGRGRIHHEARNIVRPTMPPWLFAPDAYLLPQEQVRAPDVT
jgi:hypothetical protein